MTKEIKKQAEDEPLKKVPQEEPKAKESKTEEGETKKEIIKDIEKSGVPEKVAIKKESLDEKLQKPVEEKTTEKEESKTDKKTRNQSKKPKKTEAIVNAYNVQISTKEAISVCKFIKNKKISQAIQDLEKVVLLKKAVPMKGEIPHRKGRMGSGRFPQKAARNFIRILKSLQANTSDLNEPLISEAIANLASRPFGRFGRIKRKRTHIKIIAKEKKKIKELNKKKQVKKLKSKISPKSPTKGVKV